MTTERAEPRPDEVYDARALVLHLDRLRRRAALAVGRPSYPLSRLSAATGIPRSTLHTYLSGATLPPSDALDAMVIALGSAPAEVRAWASAWDRVCDLTRGSRSASRSAHYSRFLTMDARVRDQLDRPTDRFYDLSTPIAVSERFQVGCRRQLDWLEVRTTVRSLDDGVDRYALRIGPKPLFDMDRIEITETVNCSPGPHRTLADPRVRVLEVLFGEPLSAGETYHLEFRVDFLAAHLSDEEVARRAITWDPVDSGMRGFSRQGPAFSLEACFSPDDLPEQVRQVHLTNADAEENKVRDLRLNRWCTAQMAVENPVAGLHGIRWTWPER